MNRRIREDFLRSFLDAKPRRPVRLVVNSLLEGVDVPQFIREKWGTRLILDLLPEYPLEEAYDVEAFYASLMTRGFCWRAKLKWEAIWAIIPLDGKGFPIAFNEAIPQDVRESSVLPDIRNSGEAASDATALPPPKFDEPPTTPSRPSLRVIKGGKGS